MKILYMGIVFVFGFYFVSMLATAYQNQTIQEERQIEKSIESVHLPSVRDIKKDDEIQKNKQK